MTRTGMPARHRAAAARISDSALPHTYGPRFRLSASTGVDSSSARPISREVFSTARLLMCSTPLRAGARGALDQRPRGLDRVAAMVFLAARRSRRPRARRARRPAGAPGRDHAPDRRRRIRRPARAARTAAPAGRRRAPGIRPGAALGDPLAEQARAAGQQHQRRAGARRRQRRLGVAQASARPRLRRLLDVVERVRRSARRSRRCRGSTAASAAARVPSWMLS